MVKIFQYSFLLVAAALFAMTVLLSPYQEVTVQFLPGTDPVVLSLSTLAFIYCGFGLLVAIILGLLDRAGLVLRLKKLDRERTKLIQHTGQLKTILAEDPPPNEISSTDTVESHE